MPLVTSSTSFTVTPTSVGQRIATMSYGKMPVQYYYDINIDDDQFIINVYEDKIEPAFSLADINIDFISETMLANHAMAQVTMPNPKTNPLISSLPHGEWSTSSYVVIDPPDVPGGTTATAVLNISNGNVTGITLTNPGSGYVFMPAVKAYDPEHPFPPGVTLAKQPMPQQLPGGVRVDLDPATLTTATITYLRGTLPMTIDEFKRRAVGLDHNTLWAWESNLVNIENNVKPNWEDMQSAGLDVQMIRFLDAFPYLGRTLSPVQFGVETKLIQFNRLVNILNQQSIDPTPRLEMSSQFGPSSQPFFWIFVHDKNFTSFKDCTWKFNYPINRREITHPDVVLKGSSANEFRPVASAAVANLVGMPTPLTNHIPPSTDWSDMFDPIYCVVPDEPVTAGDPVLVQVHTSPHIDYLYVQQVCGVPDRTRITLTEGVGQFNILTSTLTAGETAAAWVGFNHHPQIVEVFKDLS
jgi:hypothetical protein